jgi:hypothetical protein
MNEDLTRHLLQALNTMNELLADTIARVDHHEVEIARLLEVTSIAIEQMRQMSGQTWEELLHEKCPEDLKGGKVFRA